MGGKSDPVEFQASKDSLSIPKEKLVSIAPRKKKKGRKLTAQEEEEL